NSAHGSGGRQAVFSAVAGGKGAELRDGVDRRHDTESASSATILILATIEQIKVVAGTVPVKAHIGVAADRRRCLKIRLQTGGSRRQVDQRIYTSPIGSELSDL